MLDLAKPLILRRQKLLDRASIENSKRTSIAGKAEAIARTTTDNFIISFDKLFYVEDLELGFKPNVNIYI